MPPSVSCRRARKSGSAARADIRSGGTALSIAIGSPPAACQASGSIEANRSAVGACQDQRRFSIRPSSGASGSGRVTRTVNRRIAFTGRPYSVGDRDAETFSHAGPLTGWPLGKNYFKLGLTNSGDTVREGLQKTVVAPRFVYRDPRWHEAARGR